MNKFFRTSLVLVLTFLFTLNSCINKDYDWDNLNKEATIPVGNIPLGNISAIMIDSIISDRSSENFIYEGKDLVLVYDGEFDIDLPILEKPEIEPAFKHKNVTSRITSGPLVREIWLIEEGDDDNLSYIVEDPNSGNDNGDWDIDVKSIVFTECNLNLSVSFIGLRIEDESPEDAANIVLTVTLPDNIKVSDDQNQREYIVKASEVIEASQNGVYTLESIKVTEYTYRDITDIYYTAKLEPGVNSTVIGSNNIEFQIDFKTTDIEPYIVYANAALNQSIEDSVDDIDSLDDIFSPEDNFNFTNISMIVDVETNLGFDFDMNVKQLITHYPDAESTILMISTPLSFTAPGIEQVKETDWYVAKSNDLNYSNYIEQNLNELVYQIPSQIKYEISVTNQEREQYGFFYFNEADRVTNAAYTFRLPFSFDNLSIGFEEILEDVFSDDFAEKLFFDAGEFIIVADDVDVQLSGVNGASKKIDLVVDVIIYNENMNPIGVEVIPATIRNAQEGSKSLQINIIVDKNHVEQMKQAKHLGFNFRVKGENIRITKDDYIKINGLKFKTTNGITFEF